MNKTLLAGRILMSIIFLVSGTMKILMFSSQVTSGA